MSQHLILNSFYCNIQQQLVESSSASFVRPWDLIGKAAAASQLQLAAAHAAAHAASQRIDDRSNDEEDDEGNYLFVNLSILI